jgi:hypothetical protein
VTPKPVVIGASANGSAGSSGFDAALRLDDQYKLVQKKTDALSKKQTAFEDLNGAAKDCETIAKAVADKKDSDLSQALKDKRLKCESASSEVDAAKKEKADAEAHYKALAGAASFGGIPVQVGGSLMTPIAPGGLDVSQTRAITEVASVVKEIVAGTFNQDEFLFLCLKVLEDDKGKLDQLSNNCLKYIQSHVNLERQLNEKRIVQARDDIQERAKSLFEQFWSLVSKDDRLDDIKLSTVKKNIKPADWPQCFEGAKNKSDFQACFISSAVVGGVKRDLAKGRSNG